MTTDRGRAHSQATSQCRIRQPRNVLSSVVTIRCVKRGRRSGADAVGQLHFMTSCNNTDACMEHKGTVRTPSRTAPPFSSALGRGSFAGTYPAAYPEEQPFDAADYPAASAAEFYCSSPDHSGAAETKRAFPPLLWPLAHPAPWLPSTPTSLASRRQRTRRWNPQEQDL